MNFSRYIRHCNLLFSPDLIDRLVTHTQTMCTNKDFPVSRGLSVQEEAQRAFRIARAAWQSRDVKDSDSRRDFILTVFRDVLGYREPWVCPASGISADSSDNLSLLPPDSQSTDDIPDVTLYPITYIFYNGEGKRVLPVIVVPPREDGKDGLDDKCDSFATSQNLSAMQAMQSFLNASEPYLWAIVTNGARWRLLRDNPSLSRPCYLEVDLELLLQEGDNQFFDSLFWRLLHVSRTNHTGNYPCLWEEWRKDLEEHGARVREGLRDGVEEAICILGTGFLLHNHERNKKLLDKLKEGQLTPQAYYQQLMRMVYRLIFLSVLEERNLLHDHISPSSEANKAAISLYREGYSISRLTSRALYAADDFLSRLNSSSRLTSRALHAAEDWRHDDLWQAQRIVFSALGRDNGEPQLALPALGGLFGSQQCMDLDDCRLPNAAFLSALGFLRWAITDNKRTLIDYVNMGAEELGSVYESLLELTPKLSVETRDFYFRGDQHDPTSSGKKQKGNARKLTGSYYTPACLVELTLKTSLDPLLEDCCKDPSQAKERLRALRVIDPACGSGHFLLGAARRIAERLADASNSEHHGYSPQDFQRAMHEVIRHCIYGVDINPMAVELVRMNLWLEGYEPGKPLSFLDDHLRCGDSLLGLLSAETFMQFPIPGEAFKPAPGDDKVVCKQLSGTNRQSARDYIKSTLTLAEAADLKELESAYSESSPSEVRQYAGRWQEVMQQRNASKQAVNADIWLGAFLAPKNSADNVPTTATLNNFRSNPSIANGDPAIQAARHACRSANAFHWFLEFPEVMKNGGFDCVLGNPPWERVKIQEKEWFANTCPEIAECSNTNTRRRMIEALSKGELPPMNPEAQIALFSRFQNSLRITAASSAFVHVAGEQGGRFALTGVGDVNMFALFSETAYRLRKDSGRVGIIVPTSIATDASTHDFFNHLVSNKLLCSVYDFENREKLFPAVDSRQRFCVLSIANSPTIELACYMTHPRQLKENERIATMQVEDFARFNPNTGTCPLFRCGADAELTTKIYRSVPILCNEKTGENSWDVSFGTMLHMSNDSHFFHETREEGMLPLYEGKMIHHYDHRFNTFETTGGNAKENEVTAEQKRNPRFEPSPRYWVRHEDVLSKLPKCCKQVPEWLIGFRNITNATNERTFIVSFFPFSAVGHSMPLILFDAPPELQCALVANGSSLVFDYIVRQKLGGTNMTFSYVEQFPFLPPTAYSEQDLAYISQRVLELTYTSHSMKPLAKALGYEGEPFAWDEEHRAELKAELDAYYAKLYGLTREELAYILDPTVKYPKKCPTVTFPGLRAKEEKKYGEYRTQRLVLAAFDNLSQQGK